MPKIYPWRKGAGPQTRLSPPNVSRGSKSAVAPANAPNPLFLRKADILHINYEGLDVATRRLGGTALPASAYG
jgi:hypothetical protein